MSLRWSYSGVIDAESCYKDAAPNGAKTTRLLLNGNFGYNRVTPTNTEFREDLKKVQF